MHENSDVGQKPLESGEDKVIDTKSSITQSEPPRGYVCMRSLSHPYVFNDRYLGVWSADIKVRTILFLAFI
jgi:hypothetical protein